MIQCKNCTKYEGNCGHHYQDYYFGEIDPDLPCVDACGENGFCKYYFSKDTEEKND